MIQYLLRFPLYLAVIILRYPLAFIAIGFFAKRGALLFPFKWLSTIDNDTYGDSGWKAEHLIGTSPESYFNQVRWLWRNGGNYFNYYCIGVPFSGRPHWAFWYKRRIPFFFKRFLDLRIGWSDYALQDRCKYVFTLRVKTKE